jgi:hypothetical protein
MIAEFNDEYGDTVPVYGVTAEDIDNAPTVDAGVKRGEWIKKPIFSGKSIPICSECASVAVGAYLFGRLYKYCPHCGARMQNGG